MESVCYQLPIAVVLLAWVGVVTVVFLLGYVVYLFVRKPKPDDEGLGRSPDIIDVDLYRSQRKE